MLQLSKQLYVINKSVLCHLTLKAASITNFITNFLLKSRDKNTKNPIVFFIGGKNVISDRKLWDRSSIVLFQSNSYLKIFSLSWIGFISFLSGTSKGVPNGICAISFQCSGNFHSAITAVSINGL